MENISLVLKALSDNTRLEILKLLLERNFCAGALSGRLGITEAAICQHLKVLREAGLLKGEKQGYFIHYDADRQVILKLSEAIKGLADIKRMPCDPEDENCLKKRREMCAAHRAKAGCGGKHPPICQAENSHIKHRHGGCRNHASSGGADNK